MNCTVDVDLDCTLDGHAVSIVGSDGQVTIAVPDLPTAGHVILTGRSALRLVGIGNRSAAQLGQQGMQITLVSGNRTLATLGGTQRQLSRLLGMPNLSISIRLLVHCLIQASRRRLSFST